MTLILKIKLMFKAMNQKDLHIYIDLFEYVQIVNFLSLQVIFRSCNQKINLISFVDFVIHQNHHPSIEVSPSTTFVTPSPNTKCSQIPFPHDIDDVSMIHELPYLENEDSHLKDMFSKMRPIGMTHYGLGYLEQLDEIIPQSRFDNFVPSNCKKSSKPKMHKFFLVMEGCSKHTIDHQWMKNMLNWELYTHHEAESFDLTTPYPEKIILSHEWKTYMQKNKCLDVFL